MEDKIGKPLKLGALWWMTGGFKKGFKSRFSILTTHYELDWYKKQEDSKDGKRGGTLKKLNSCKIEEIEDQLGQTHCFLISNGNRNSQVLAADTERERLNWIVEILKFRGIDGLVGMIKDPEEKLSRHAAYALCNLAGRLRDDSQTKIVEVGGVQALLSYQKTCDEVDLVDSINYSFCKLSSREENKMSLSNYLDHFYDLLDSQNERWIDFSLQTILNFSTNELVQHRIFDTRGIEKLTEIITQNALKEGLIKIGVEVLYNCAVDEKICNRVKLDQLPIITKLFPSYSPVIKEQIIKLLARCIINEEDLEDMTVLQNLIPLLVHDNQTLKLEAIKFLSNMTKFHKFRPPVRNSAALSNLLGILKDEDPNIVLYAIRTILHCWCDDNYLPILASFGIELQSVVDLLLSDSLDILSTTLTVLSHLINLRASLEMISEFKELAKLLVSRLILLQKKEIPEELQNNCISILRVLSNFPPFKISFCHQDIFSEIISQINSGKQQKLLIVNLDLISNCSTLAIIKKEVRLSGLPLKLLEILSSDSLIIQKNSLKVLRHSILCARSREGLLECECTAKLLLLLSSPDDKIVALALDCLSRLAYSNLAEQEIVALGGLAILIKLLDSQNPDLVKGSISVIRNCSGGVSSKIIRQTAIPSIVKILKSRKNESLENSIVTLAVCFNSAEKNDSCFEIFIKEGGDRELMSLISFENAEIQNLALWALCEYSTHTHTNINFDQKCIERLIEYLSDPNERNIENALEIIDYFTLNNKFIMQENFLAKLVSLLSSPNYKCVTLAASLLQKSSNIQENKQILAKLLNQIYKYTSHPNESIRNSLSVTILNTISNKNEIEVANTIGLDALFSLWKSNSVSVSNSSHLKLKIRTESPFSVELFSPKNSILTVEYQSRPVMINHIASASSHFHSSEKVELKKKETMEREKKNRKKKIGNSNGDLSPRSDDHSEEIIISRSSRSASFLPGNTKKVRPKAVSGISAGSYRSRSGTSGKDDLSVNRLLPRQIDSFQLQMIALSYYRSYMDEATMEYAPAIRSYIHQYFPKKYHPIEEYPIDNEDVTFRENLNGTLKISQNIVEYISLRDFGIVGVAQATKPLSTKGSYGYFEVYILSTGKNGSIGVGVACSNYPLDQQPGWKNGGWGYHGDDGNKYWFDDQNWRNDAFGPTFCAGDVIGCGINNISHQLFFTKNGFVIDSLGFSNVPANIYPTVGLASTGERVLINTGQFPFLWDFDIENIQDTTPGPKSEQGFEREQKKIKREVGLYELEFEKMILNKFDFLSYKKRKTKS